MTVGHRPPVRTTICRETRVPSGVLFVNRGFIVVTPQLFGRRSRLRVYIPSGFLYNLLWCSYFSRFGFYDLYHIVFTRWKRLFMSFTLLLPLFSPVTLSKESLYFFTLHTCIKPKIKFVSVAFFFKTPSYPFVSDTIIYYISCTIINTSFTIIISPVQNIREQSLRIINKYPLTTLPTLNEFLSWKVSRPVSIDSLRGSNEVPRSLRFDKINAIMLQGMEKLTEL